MIYFFSCSRENHDGVNNIAKDTKIVAMEVTWQESIQSAVTSKWIQHQANVNEQRSRYSAQLGATKMSLEQLFQGV
jgi:hypothetical protein